MTYSTTTETQSMTGDTFFANVGGILGLCLGISVLSVIEIFELFLELAKIFAEYRIQRKINDKILFMKTNKQPSCK